VKAGETVFVTVTEGANKTNDPHDEVLVQDFMFAAVGAVVPESTW